MSNVVLIAPLEGWSAPLDEVPDPVFAGRLLGDGVAIDPTASTLYAPCDGEIVTVPPQKHAITLRAANGAQILLHVGIDTVALGGEGFEQHVEAGARVKAGDRLLSFDLDLLAQRAKSLLTPMIVTDEAPFQIVRRSTDREIAVGDFLMELAPAGAGSEAIVRGKSGAALASASERVSGAGSNAGEHTARLVVPLEHGLHARPAALIASRAKQFSATIAIGARGKSANARSATAIMSLGIRKNDEITLTASGPDAPAALTALETAIRTATATEARNTPRSTEGPIVIGGRHLRASEGAARGDGSEFRAGTAGVAKDASLTAAAVRNKAGSRISAETAAARQGDSNLIHGVVAVPGLAVGTAVHLTRAEIEVSEAGTGTTNEHARLDTAITEVAAQVRGAMANERGPGHEVLAAHLEFLDDPELIAHAREQIANGKSAGFAWRHAVRANVEALQGLPDPRMAERAADLLDLETQVLTSLGGKGNAQLSGQALPEHAIVLAADILPSQFIALDATRVVGICTAGGGPTSHVAILAAAANLPMLVAAGASIDDIPEGTPLILDADRGTLQVSPLPEQRASAEATTVQRRARHAAERAAAQRECRTADGVRIEVFANVGSVAEARAAVAQGAEGCGLLRTEFLFLDRQTAPDEAAQTALYSGVVAAFNGRPVVVRTLDAGGDKPLAYMHLPVEENPALGMRGVRASLLYPQILRAQLRAILSAQPRGRCRILLPMISSPAEVRGIGEMLDEVRREIGHDESVPLGAMIETPAAAMIADQIAREADFLSIGTNDLTQYTLAIDRGNPVLAARLDSLHPAVLRLIARAAQGARLNHRQIAVCGGLASDPTAAPILIGLGITELSAVPAMVPRLKALISTLTFADCEALAQQALEQTTPAEVRALASALITTPLLSEPSAHPRKPRVPSRTS